jgi:hypothetical protein
LVPGRADCGLEEGKAEFFFTYSRGGRETGRRTDNEEAAAAAAGAGRRSAMQLKREREREREREESRNYMKDLWSR